MKRRYLVSVAVTLGLVVVASSQTLDPRWLPQIDLKQISIVGDVFGSQIVTGKPFSATEERHAFQVLGNGTRIENSQSNRLYRDNEGRTVLEDMGGAITIIDPVAGFRAELSPKTKVARRTLLLGARFRGAGVRGAPEDGASFFEQYRQKAAKQLEELQNARQDLIQQAKATASETENLGNQNVSGISSQGTRTTMTIPKGQIGNDREIKVITEQWFSNDLGLLVKSSTFDPRFGDTTYQLTNIVRAAADPALFQIPSDYTITGPPLPPAPGQGGGPGGRGGRGGPRTQ
jgi:hypothetical protein